MANFNSPETLYRQTSWLHYDTCCLDKMPVDLWILWLFLAVYNSIKLIKIVLTDYNYPFLSNHKTLKQILTLFISISCQASDSTSEVFSTSKSKHLPRLSVWDLAALPPRMKSLQRAAGTARAAWAQEGGALAGGRQAVRWDTWIRISTLSQQTRARQYATGFYGPVVAVDACRIDLHQQTPTDFLQGNAAAAASLFA